MCLYSSLCCGFFLKDNQKNLRESRFGFLLCISYCMKLRVEKVSINFDLTLAITFCLQDEKNLIPAKQFFYRKEK